ncbi:S8 family peptidase [Chryseobacterium caseinilyticum]|uniref:S8 family serine peptidase n=1 Tax=Chryseobacterium caseinilyticum TaxID=2771428 RepID=A0ABR8ZE46_9FLAO|nr:S8 family peptidase [Chryseobacterium caseinilyticum]MBD8083487.1 S8 family serine peptidase [Chryseobacterium caseinilyticum]
MKKHIFTIFSTLLLSLCNAQDFEKNQLIIKVKNESFNKGKHDLAKNIIGVQSVDRLNNEHLVNKITPIGDVDFTTSFLLEFKNDIDVASIAKIYGEDSKIAFAEPNYIAHGAGVQGNASLSTFPTDTFFSSRQWSLYNTGTFVVSGMTTTPDADVDMELAWDIETGDPNMIIAVADSGINFSHEDFAGRIWNKPTEIIGDGIDNDGNGLIDDYRGWDWVNNDNNPTDDHGHGTNCTGIIGSAANNAKGYAGVNWNSKMMPLKVLDSGNNGTYANMANSLYYAANNGAKIVSMSIGGTAPSAALASAINYLRTNNVLLVACMMNNNNQVSNYPAAYSTAYDNVIAVGSTDANDKRTQPFFWSTTSGSCYGTHINVVAPGNFIYGLGIDSNTSYGSYWGGTSQATPLVAGVASLIFAKNPTLTPAQVRNILQTTAEDMKGIPSEDTPGFDKYHGWGRINAYTALQSTVLSSHEVVNDHFAIRIINPVSNGNLEIYNNRKIKGTTRITVSSFEGKQIFNQTLDLKEGKNSVQMKGIITGSYILNFENKEYQKIFKIIVK